MVLFWKSISHLLPRGFGQLLLLLGRTILLKFDPLLKNKRDYKSKFNPSSTKYKIYFISIVVLCS